MATLDVSWAFGNAELSDISIVLTTESLEACRARLCDSARPLAAPAVAAPPSSELPVRSDNERLAANAPEPAAAGAPDAEPQDAQEQHVFEEVPGHKLVLFSCSEYFKVACSWQAHSATASKKRKLEHLDGDAVNAGGQQGTRNAVILSLAGPEWLPRAKAMLEFMYTQKLPADITRSEAMHLYCLGDQYNVNSLRLACLQHLTAEPLRWAAVERHQLLAMMHIIGNDSAADGALGTASSKLLTAVKQHVLKLEAFWKTHGNQDAFQNLPQSVVLEVLQSDGLLIKSEATALVAALSWLRGSQGTQATLAERQQVLHVVRVLLLPPWFLTWLLCNVPEAKELLGLDYVTKLTFYLACDYIARDKLLRADQQMQQWNRGRAAPLVGGSVSVSCSWELPEFLATVRDARADPSKGGAVSGTPVFHAGLEFNAQMSVYSLAEEPATIKLWGGVYAQLRVAGEYVQAGPGVLGWPAKFTTRWCSANKQGLEDLMACPLGDGWGVPFKLKPESNAAEAVRANTIGAEVVLQALLLDP